MADDWIQRTLTKYPEGSEARQNFLRTLGEYKTLGRTGYMAKYPEVFTLKGVSGTPTSFYIGEIDAEINDLRYALSQYVGPGYTAMRWLLQKQIDVKWAERERLAGRKANIPIRETPMPDWMRDYLEMSIPGEMSQYAPGLQRAGRGRGTATPSPQTPALRPIGAQAELTPDQMAEMAGYAAWQKAGSPTQYSDWALKAMSDWQGAWQPHVALSESLFPKKAKLRTGWATALQR